MSGAKVSKVLSGMFVFLLVIGFAVTQSASSPDVSIGDNGIDVNSGRLDMGDRNITSADRVDGVELDNPGSFLDVVSGQYVVDGSSIQSGTSASDVGLGSVENEAAVAESGDTMTGILNMSENDIKDVRGISLDSRTPPGSGVISWGATPEYNPVTARGIELVSGDDISLKTNADGSEDDGNIAECYMTDGTDPSYSPGAWICDATKSWAHDLNNGSEAVYTSQESPMVRAVYEGNATVSDGGVNVSLPSHFSKTVSDSKPMLRVQATPHELATVAVTERTDDYLVIEASSDVEVDYRVTGIREGYEDQQVVRSKDE